MFLVLLIVSEDYKIPSNELIEYWICEGLIEKRETREDTMDKGHAILDELIKVSMLELTKIRGNCKFVRMHDLIRDMAVRIIRIEGPPSMINADVQLKDSPIEWPQNAERISLMQDDIEEVSGQPKCFNLLTFVP